MPGHLRIVPRAAGLSRASVGACATGWIVMFGVGLLASVCLYGCEDEVGHSKTTTKVTTETPTQKTTVTETHEKETTVSPR